jgi:hypothetical protein
VLAGDNDDLALINEINQFSCRDSTERIHHQAGWRPKHQGRAGRDHPVKVAVAGIAIIADMAEGA